MKEARVLIVGGAGFIGCNLAYALGQRGIVPTIAHRPGGIAEGLRDVEHQSLPVDLVDEQSVEDILFSRLQDFDVVFNLAICSSPLRRFADLRQRVNVIFPAMLSQAIRERSDSRLVHVSSSAAVGYPRHGEVVDETFQFNGDFDDYAVSKRQGEMAVMAEVEKGLDAVVALPCSSVGARGMKPEQRATFESIAAGRMRMYPPGGLCLTSVADLSAGLIACAESGRTGERYILGGSNIAYREYFDAVAEASGGAPPRIKLPKLLLPLMGWGVDMLGRVLGKDIAINADVARMISLDLFYSSAKAERELGYIVSPWRGVLATTVRELGL